MSWMEVEGAGWRRVHGLAILLFTITKRNKITSQLFCFCRYYNVIILSWWPQNEVFIASWEKLAFLRMKVLNMDNLICF